MTKQNGTITKFLNEQYHTNTAETSTLLLQVKLNTYPLPHEETPEY